MTGIIIGIIVLVAFVGIIVYRYCFEDRIKASRKKQSDSSELKEK